MDPGYYSDWGGGGVLWLCRHSHIIGLTVGRGAMLHIRNSYSGILELLSSHIVCMMNQLKVCKLVYYIFFSHLSPLSLCARMKQGNILPNVHGFTHILGMCSMQLGGWAYF